MNPLIANFRNYCKRRSWARLYHDLSFIQSLVGHSIWTHNHSSTL